MPDSLHLFAVAYGVCFCWGDIAPVGATSLLRRVSQALR